MMTKKEYWKKREEWIIDYLYGELNDEQKETFELTLNKDARLKELYAQHIAIDNLIPKGVRPLIDGARMQGVRWSALKGVRQGQKLSLIQRLATVWEWKILTKFHVASMVCMFVAGFIFNGILEKTQPHDSISEDDSVLAFVESSDYQIVDMNLYSYDKNNGEIQFSFSMDSQSKMSGNMNSPIIRHMLAQRLKTESSDNVRLEIIELFGGYLHAQDIIAALIHVLLNDANPGARYNAVEHLVKESGKEDVKNALRYALVSDVNPGVRIEAFLAVTENIDSQTLKVLKSHSINDANTFIRERSKKIIDNMRGGAKKRNNAIAI